MRSAPVRLLLASLFLTAFSLAACAHGYKHKAIEIVHPWTFDRPVPGSSDAIVGMDIKNAGEVPDRLIGASSAITARVAISGAAEPSRPAGPTGIEIGPGAKVELGAKGPHLRLIGLKKELTAYDTLPVTLMFEKAGRIRIDVLVEESSEPQQ
jgi:hypothetical protein